MTESKWYLSDKLKYHILRFIRKNYIYIYIYTYKGLEFAKSAQLQEQQAGQQKIRVKVDQMMSPLGRATQRGAEQ